MMNNTPQTPPPLDYDYQAAAAKWTEEENYTLLDWFKKSLKDFSNFSGRSRRKEYWYFVLSVSLIAIVASAIDNIFDMDEVLVSLVGLIFFLPGLALSVRRLHDINKSGWWYLISFIPFVGSLILFIFACMDTKPNINQWGVPARRVI
ncbi:DUF805 domain-containing protein [Psychrobacter lutiphocae]|uniref:DUF805 domain-containing protein n=1 Tax=Psychrobacter lutiphocae TaxID=540500 RepID=UPI000368C7F4|nr:DUF805 domain-containing protein [Psychrobacter lutiphocae]